MNVWKLNGDYLELIFKEYQCQFCDKERFLKKYFSLMDDGEMLDVSYMDKLFPTRMMIK
jgi:hypothetical protein